MLKYYIVTEQSKVFEQYWKYDSTLKCIQKAFGSFADEYDIKANKFHTLADRLYICADRCLWRLFDVDSVIYCTFESEAKFVAPKGFQEIDEKEFYSIMESHNVEILKEIY